MAAKFEQCIYLFEFVVIKMIKTSNKIIFQKNKYYEINDI